MSLAATRKERLNLALGQSGDYALELAILPVDMRGEPQSVRPEPQ
ncbi:hypothetical protein [Pseudacidovorax sp.]|nr:hypothetical protein [Pseudacidovorax sp.]